MPRLVACALAVLAAAGIARAGEENEDEEAPRPHEDHGRPGRPVAYATPPVLAAPMRVCSLALPLCLHAERRLPPAAALAILGSAERAWSILAGAVALPPPDVDPATLTYPVYAVEGAEEPASTEIAARDVRSRIDRARGFTVVDARARPGCALDAAMAAAIARAMLLRAAPATDEGTARAQTTYLARLVAPCSLGLAADAALAFQSAPERAIPDAHAGSSGAAMPATWPGQPSPPDLLFAEGAALAWARVDWAFARTPGGIVRAAWALAPTKTPLGAPFWRDEPDAYDVLRESFKGAFHSGSTLADLMLDVAIARAFLGAADDGAHEPETRALGDAARVPLDWDLPWPAQPRRLAPRAAVYPTGASYLLVHRAGAAPGARLRVEIAWEEHALFRWAFVKLDAAGRELGRVLIPARERAVEAQMTLVDLDKVDRVLLVGVNTGDPAYHFDPDDEVWEPHAWIASLAAE
jgi:hypothetical protein